MLVPLGLGLAAQALSPPGPAGKGIGFFPRETKQGQPGRWVLQAAQGPGGEELRPSHLVSP